MKWLLTSFLKISLHCWDWMALGSEFHRLIDWYRKVHDMSESDMKRVTCRSVKVR